MPKEKITRRQKNISRLLREKKQAYRDKLKTFKKEGKLKGINMSAEEKLTWLRELNELLYKSLSDKEKKQKFNRRFAGEKW